MKLWRESPGTASCGQSAHSLIPSLPPSLPYSPGVPSCPCHSPGTMSPSSWWLVAGGTGHDSRLEGCLCMEGAPWGPAWPYPPTLCVETLGISGSSSREGGRRRESFGAPSKGPASASLEFLCQLASPFVCTPSPPLRQGQPASWGWAYFLEPLGSGGVLCSHCSRSQDVQRGTDTAATCRDPRQVACPPVEPSFLLVQLSCMTLSLLASLQGMEEGVDGGTSDELWPGR